MKKLTVPPTKKVKKATLPGTNVTGHLAEFQRTRDDNMFQNAVAQLIGEICDKEGWQFKQVVKALMKPVMETYLSSLEESTSVEVKPINSC